MLDYFRKHANSPVVKVFYLSIAFTMVAGFGGLMARSSCEGEATDPSTVATVAGRPIRVRELERSADRIRERLQERMGGELDAKMLEMFRIEQQALDQLVNEALLLEGARLAGIHIPNDEVIEAIRRNPAFARDSGGFSAEKYHDILKRNGIPPGGYEADVRRQLSLERLQQLVSAGVIVTDAQTRERHRLDTERIELQYLTFDPAQLEPSIPEPDAAALDAFFQSHKDQFKEPAKVRVAFLTIDPKDIEPEIKVEDEDLRQRYERDQKRYQQPESVTARHILIRLEEGATEEEAALAEARAQEILARLEGGADFAEEAKQSSEDPSNKDRGGDLGSFSRGRMVKAFEDAAFGATVGKLTAPVRTPFGYHIIRVDTHDPERTVPFEEVSESIRKVLVGEKAQKLAEARANAIRKELLAKGPSADWKAVAEEKKLASGEAGPAAAGEPIDGARALTDAALALKQGEWTQPVRTGKGFQLAQVLERQEERPLSLDEARDKVSAAHKKEEAHNEARARADAAREKIAAGAAADAVGTELEAPVQATGPFALTARSVPGLGTDESVLSAALALNENDRVAPRPLETSGRFVVLTFASRSSTDSADPAKQQEALESTRARLLAEQQNLALVALIEQLKGEVKLSYNEELMKQLFQE